MRLRFAVLTILTCSALPACGGDEAPAEAERPKDFRTAANEVCRAHNLQTREIRERHRGEQITLDEAVDSIRDEAFVKEDQVRDLRALNAPAEAKPYFARLDRNVVGMREAATDLMRDGGESYEQFWATMQNSEDTANRQAATLGLKDCSPPVTQQ